jgi:hypothetical protein
MRSAPTRASAALDLGGVLPFIQQLWAAIDDLLDVLVRFRLAPDSVKPRR